MIQRIYLFEEENEVLLQSEIQIQYGNKGHDIMPLEVVYIDDEHDLCEMFSEAFTTPNVHITSFIDPNVALINIASKAPDLIFIDFRLPNITGDKLALKMNPKIPKVLITGDLQVKVEAIFDRVFYKPVDFDQVARYLEGCYQMRKNSKTT
jgi:DNA-binding NtrC family response regulator